MLSDLVVASKVATSQRDRSRGGRHEEVLGTDASSCALGTASITR
jgi:hypothetical protein